MRVITEKKLLAKRELLNDKSSVHSEYMDGKRYLIDELIESCEEIDTLTVSNLRPMSELLENDDSVFAAYKDKTGNISFDITSGNRIEEQSCFLTEEYIGWILVIKPIYKPEE